MESCRNSPPTLPAERIVLGSVDLRLSFNSSRQGACLPLVRRWMTGSLATHKCRAGCPMTAPQLKMIGAVMDAKTHGTPQLQDLVWWVIVCVMLPCRFVESCAKCCMTSVLSMIQRLPTKNHRRQSKNA